MVLRATRKLRYNRLRMPRGNPIDRVADDFHARVVQHECDHTRRHPLTRSGMTDMSKFEVHIEELFPPGEDLVDE
jgi:peptide deformylase